MPAPAAPLLLAADGDGLVHRAFHAMAGSDDRDAAGRPVWALRGLVTFLASACARLRPDALVVGFDCRQHSVRRADYPGYKAHRAEKPPELAAQLEAAPELLEAAGVPVVVGHGFEADDVLASASALARAGAWRSTLVTSDRDAFALVDDTTSVLRLVNGGVDASPVITPAALVGSYGVSAGQYRDYAALRGDISDNLPGVPGIGRALAARLLAAFGTLDAAFAALESGRLDDVAAVVGSAAGQALAGPEAREIVDRNRRLMAMRGDLALPGLEALRLPLDRERLRAALRARQINLGPSLWAMVGEPEPSWLGLGGYDRAPSYLPGAVTVPPSSAVGVLTPAVVPVAPPVIRPAAGRKALTRGVPVGQLPLF